MSDARNAQPSLEDQINAFKGFTVVDGETRPEQPDELDMGERLRATNGGEDEESATEKAAKAAEKAAEKAAKGDDKSDKPKDKNDPQKRINQAVGRQRTAERALAASEARAASLEARIAALEAGNKPALTQNPAPGNDVGRPDPSKYQYGELDTKYISDLARFEARQEMQAERDRDRKSNESRREQQAQTAHAAAMAEFVDKGSEIFDDFDEVVMESAKAGEWELTPVVGELILESDLGPQIAYFLATNPKEASKIAKLSPARQAAWFGQKEAELSSGKADAGKGNAPAFKPSKAPPLLPNRGRGAGGAQPPSPATTDFAAFERMAMAKP
jgi:hypothetical protein